MSSRSRTKLVRILACAVFLPTLGVAQTMTLTLRNELSSKMASGTRFTARDALGKSYLGHIVTHPARRLLRSGSMLLVFDDPVVPITRDREGVFRGGNKIRLLKLGGSLAAAKLAESRRAKGKKKRLKPSDQ